MTNSIQPLELNFQDVTLTSPIAEGHRMIPVRTICQIIDVDFRSQDNWLKKHEIYSQLYRLSTTTGADGKQYKMSCLSFFDAFGWLNSITLNNRKDGSVEKQYLFMAWLREQHMKIYKTIDVYMQENKYEIELVELKEQTQAELNSAKEMVKELSKKIKEIDTTIEDIRVNRFTGQTALPFPSDN